MLAGAPSARFSARGLAWLRRVPLLTRTVAGGPLARTLAHPVRVHARSPLLAAAASEMSTAANPEPRFFTSFDVYKARRSGSASTAHSQLACLR
jgi:hypothetical protein